MGCEKFRDGGLGVGGVRASMERRWLINAKTTVMRRKKWQEVRMQKEQEEMKKVAEILEGRKRERARLAAYIHMQPAKCTANASKCSKIENKRSNWNTCLMEDQEIIMRFREKSAVAHNSYYQKANLAADTFWQGSESVQPCGTYTNSYLKGYHAPEQNFVMGTRYMEDMAYESYSNPEKYHPDTDHMSEVSATKCSSKSEPVRFTSWAPDAPTYASLVEDTRQQSVAKTIRLSANAHEKEDDSPSAIQSENAARAPPKKNNHLDISKLAESYAEAYRTTPKSAALRQDGSTSAEPTCDLREEILKARQTNEAATARLIAEVNAIESHLEDCNVSLKHLDFRGAEPDGVTEELNRYTSDTDSLSCDSLGETDSNLSSDSDEATSKLFSKRTADSNNESRGKPQRKQMIMETAACAASDPQRSNDLDWNTVTVGIPKTYHDMNYANTEIKSKAQEEQRSLRTLRNRAAVASPSPKPSTDIDTVGSPEPLGLQATRETYTHHKAVKEVNSGAMGEDKLASNSSTKKTTSLVWDIDWDTPAARWLQKKMDGSQINQHVSPSRMPGRGEWKVPTKQNTKQQQLTENIGSLREERQRFECCHKRPPTIPEGGGNMFRTKVHMPPLPLHHLNFGFSQPMYRGNMQMQSLHPSYPQEEITMQEDPRGPMRRIDSTGGKENYRKMQSGSFIEEEEIFASLERLDWKLAAVQSRSVSSGRDSFASQGEFSTKSAPAVMGPPISKLGLAGLHCAKKPLPYSTVPPRPLTPQSHRPPTGLRKRRQVGLTNKGAGKAPHGCLKYPAGTSTDNAGHSVVGSEKWNSRGTIFCHPSAREFLDAAAVC